MSTIDDFRSATFAAQSYDATVGVAYASSPLGDPAIDDGFLPHPAEFDEFPPTTVTAEPPAEPFVEPVAEVPAEPRPSRWTNLLVGAAVVAALGTVSGLGVMLVNGTGPKETPALVVPNSSVGSVPPQAPSAVPLSPVAAPPSLAAPADGGQGSAGPGSGGDAPAWTGPAPALAPVDPGTPPAPPAPHAPPVIVKAPPPVVVVPPPHHEGGKHHDDDEPGGGQQGGGQNGGGQPGGSGQQGGKGQKVGGPPAPIGGGHPGQVACLPCQQPHTPGKK
jgi:hypothetical protein